LDHLLKKTTASNVAEDDPLGLFGSKKPIPVSAPPSEPVASKVPVEASPSPVSSQSIPDFSLPSPVLPVVESVSPSIPMPSFNVETVPPPGSVLSFDLNREAAAARTPQIKVWWWKLEKALKPFARTSRLPVPVFAALCLLLLLLVPATMIWNSSKPSITVLESIQPIHIVRVASSQVGELDITSFLEQENKLKEMGFSPLLQYAIPQVTSPSFVSVYAKDAAGTYAELIKVPGVSSVKLSFVTVLNNGLWCSTNGWEGKDIVEDYLMSSHHSNDTPDALYVKHMQQVEQLRKQNAWVPSRVGESRYVGALSDHLRWFLQKRNVAFYRTTYDQWH